MLGGVDAEREALSTRYFDHYSYTGHPPPSQCQCKLPRPRWSRRGPRASQAGARRARLGSARRHCRLSRRTSAVGPAAAFGEAQRRERDGFCHSPSRGAGQCAPASRRDGADSDWPGEGRRLEAWSRWLGNRRRRPLSLTGARARPSHRFP